MPAKSRRTYSSPQREQQANATRRHILDTAAQLFAEQGYLAVSMGHIASEAGVSIATVYLYFSGKAAIVEAMANDVAAMPDLNVERVERETDPVRQLRIGAHILRKLNERSWVAAEILRTARAGDESLQAIWTQWQERHLHAIRRGIEALHYQGSLRDGLILDEAVDTFYALGGTDVYRSLTLDRNWSPEQYEEWLFQLGVRELLSSEQTR